MAHRIEVTTQDHLPDPRGAALIANAHEELGIDIDRARVVDVYSIDLDLKEVDLARVRDELLTDPVAEKSSVGKPLLEDWDYWIEVGFRPGVTDNVGGTASEGIADLLNLPSTSQRTVFVATGYAIQDDRLSKDQVEKIAHGMLANDLIEEASVYSKDQFPGDEGFPIRIPKVHLPETPPVETYNLDVSDAELESLSKKNTWALTLAEMQSIRDHFQSAEVQVTRKELGLPEQPTDVELEVLAQTWSEHCKHKIFASNCIYREGDGEPRRIQNLFKTTIKKTTEELAKKKDWLVSVFHDNAGAIRFTEDYHLTIKVETHNSPSALDPYGGALTGIVGVNRDPLGTGMGCRLIFNTDVFCFGLPHEERELPPPLLHPRRIL
ncbi:MAG: phosphoribosylformylglycinamidine synthase, partial [Candidatus Omnitrophica bacterium]|nr:phosphoribosylformylglycinamidine synthase [Candidatus Omnitrophota bacterium]